MCENIGSTAGTIEVILSVPQSHGAAASLSDLSGYEPGDGLALLDAIAIAVERVIVWAFLVQPDDTRVSDGFEFFGVVSFTGASEHEVLEMVFAGGVPEAKQGPAGTGLLITIWGYVNNGLLEQRLARVEFRQGEYVCSKILDIDNPEGY